jgi:ketosteroid isomerase-like protein
MKFVLVLFILTAANKIFNIMQSYLTPLILMSLCLACSSDATDEKKIADVRVAFNLAIANHDLSRMDEYCTDDVMVLTSRNARSASREQYTSFLEQDFKSKDDVVYVRTPQLIEVFPAWNTASESGRWVGKWKADTATINVSGSYYAKWKRVNDKWLISAEVFTALECSGGKYCQESPK